MVNSQKPRSENELRELHTETCPRISDPGAECLTCEVFQHLKRARDRHVRYLNGIKEAIGDDRWKTATGEPERSDKAEIGFMRRALEENRATVRELTERLRDWIAGATGAATIMHKPRTGPHTEAAYCTHKAAYERGTEDYRAGADEVSAGLVAAMRDVRDTVEHIQRHIEAGGANEELSRLAYEPGTLMVVFGGLGIPSLVCVDPDGSWMCVAGIFHGRRINTAKSVRHICRDGDIFEDLGVEVKNGCLVPVEIKP